MSNATATSVTTTIHQDGLTDISTTTVLAGIQIPPLETTLTYGAPLTINDGIGVLAHANLNMICIKSDSLDATVAFHSATAGGGSTIATENLIAGQAYEWDSSKGTSPLGTTDCLSIVITLLQTVNGVASALTTSDIHGRSSLTA